MSLYVVIPAYNVEKTLRQTLDCVLGQTWENLQVILVSKEADLEAATLKVQEQQDALNAQNGSGAKIDPHAGHNH